MLKSEPNTNTAQQDALQAVLRCGNAIAAFAKVKESCDAKKIELRKDVDTLQELVSRLSAAGLCAPGTENILSVAEGLLHSQTTGSALIVQIDRDFQTAKQLFNEARVHIQGRPKTYDMYEDVVRISKRTERLANEAKAKLDGLFGRMSGGLHVVRESLQALDRLEHRLAQGPHRPGPQLSP